MTMWPFRDEPVIIFLRLATLAVVVLGALVTLAAFVMS